MRIALVAGLILGVVAMHSFGHTSHTEQDGQIVVTAHGVHHGHAMDTGPVLSEDDSDQSALLSVLGLMVCAAIVARFAFEFVRSAGWSRLWSRRIAALERIENAPAQRWLPPPRPQPTGIQVNRIAVLRI
jgi:hypothetical protein